MGVFAKTGPRGEEKAAACVCPFSSMEDDELVAEDMVRYVCGGKLQHHC